MAQSAAIENDLKNGKDSTSSSVKDRAAKTLEKGVQAAQDTFEQAAFQAELATEQAGTELRKITDASAKFVRNNPGTAVAGAVGVGILVGLALRGRS
ncbi:hypothetical protein [Algirhabdus cladophorae]|uniref:hypothetical protein n=1 Tax=Algirhabdus cladophorae TaxID=3377108 RepID=UPI003B84B191